VSAPLDTAMLDKGPMPAPGPQLDAPVGMDLGLAPDDGLASVGVPGLAFAAQGPDALMDDLESDYGPSLRDPKLRQRGLLAVLQSVGPQMRERRLKHGFKGEENADLPSERLRKLWVANVPSGMGSIPFKIAGYPWRLKTEGSFVQVGAGGTAVGESYEAVFEALRRDAGSARVSALAAHFEIPWGEDARTDPSIAALVRRYQQADLSDAKLSALLARGDESSPGLAALSLLAGISMAETHRAQQATEEVRRGDDADDDDDDDGPKRPSGKRVRKPVEAGAAAPFNAGIMSRTALLAIEEGRGDVTLDDSFYTDDRDPTRSTFMGAQTGGADVLKHPRAKRHSEALKRQEGLAPAHPDRLVNTLATLKPNAGNGNAMAAMTPDERAAALVLQKQRKAQRIARMTAEIEGETQQVARRFQFAEIHRWAVAADLLDPKAKQFYGTTLRKMKYWSDQGYDTALAAAALDAYKAEVQKLSTNPEYAASRNKELGRAQQEADDAQMPQAPPEAPAAAAASAASAPSSRPRKPGMNGSGKRPIGD
jgi:hypothetical protein